jgi:hypothetical protein
VPADPFSPEQRPAVVAALDDIHGTEGEDQVIIATSGGTMDVAHIDDQFAVYLEWDRPGMLDDLGLALPPDAEVFDDSGGNATIGFGTLDAPGVVKLLASWAEQLFEGRPFEWSSSLDD